MEVSLLVQDDTALDKHALNEVLRRRSELVGAGETVRLEFKASFDDGTRAWAELLKDVVAFHNGDGGLIVLGVSDSGALVGLDKTLGATLDPSNLGNKLGKYAPNARLDATYFEWQYHRKRYGVLRVPAGRSIVVFDKPGNYPTGDGDQKNAFQEGVIYIRSSGKCAPAKQSDVDRLFRSSVDHEMSRRLAQIELVASLPSSTQLLARNPSEPGAAYILQSKDTGTPVVISGDADPEDAVLLAEVLDTHAPYGSLESEIKQQVRFWRAHPDHRAGADTLHDWFLRSDGLELDEDAAEFCFLSAIKGFAFGMIWAAQLPKRRLAEVLRREREAPWHPLSAVIPYVIATFFWEDRKEMLAEWRPHLTGSGSSVADRILSLSRREFLTRGRNNVQTFAHPADPRTRLDASVLADSRNLTEEIFTIVVRSAREDGASVSAKQLGYQCDILLAAPDGPREGT